MIGCNELRLAVAAGKDIFKKLRAEYPKLKGYLVLAHCGPQAGLTASPLDVLLECEQMVVADVAKRDVLRLLAEKKRLEAARAGENAIQRISRELAVRVEDLRFVPEVQIELRFEDLRFELVWALQKSPLIDRDLTPQTKASIRIVLGTLATLSRIKDKQQG